MQSVQLNILKNAANLDEPLFDIVMREDDLRKLRGKNLLKLGNLFDLNNLTGGIKLVQPPNGGLIQDEKEIKVLFSQLKVLLQGFSYHTNIPGVGRIQVTPEVDPYSKIKYLISIFKQ